MNTWQTKWGTRLKGYFRGKDGHIDESRQLPHHDDWDCLEDMEEAGLIEIVSVINAIVTMTPKGIKLAAFVRAHKARGGNFAGFEFKPEMIQEEVPA